MRQEIELNYDFHPVGQGLFASGRLKLIRDEQSQREDKQFLWVYDCGSFNEILLDSAIDNFHKNANNEIIDLLAISHFDEDHINGIPKLSKLDEF